MKKIVAGELERGFARAPTRRTRAAAAAAYGRCPRATSRVSRPFPAERPRALTPPTQHFFRTLGERGGAPAPARQEPARCLIARFSTRRSSALRRARAHHRRKSADGVRSRRRRCRMDVTSCFSKRFRNRAIGQRVQRQPLQTLAPQVGGGRPAPTPRASKSPAMAPRERAEMAAPTRGVPPRSAGPPPPPPASPWPTRHDFSNARMNRPRRSAGTTATSASIRANASARRSNETRRAPPPAGAPKALRRRGRAASSERVENRPAGKPGEEYSTPAMGVASRLTEIIDSSSSSSETKAAAAGVELAVLEVPDRTPVRARFRAAAHLSVHAVKHAFKDPRRDVQGGRAGGVHPAPLTGTLIAVALAASTVRRRVRRGDAQPRTGRAPDRRPRVQTRQRRDSDAPVPLDRRSPRSAVTSSGRTRGRDLRPPPFLNLAAARRSCPRWPIERRRRIRRSRRRNLIACFVVGVSHRGRQM